MDDRTDADIKFNFICPATDVHIRKVTTWAHLSIYLLILALVYTPNTQVIT